MPKAAPGWPDHLILFDGVCVLCSSWVRRVIRWDDKGLFRFVPVQSPHGRQLAERLGIDPEFAETNAVVIGGTAYFKSDAVIEIARRLRGLRWVSALRFMPKGLRDRFYDAIARNRYAWFGRDEACLRPTPDISARLWDAGNGNTPP
jgi:predicted DCC family thiol-disulfide oxidoreductase YuxK